MQSPADQGRNVLRDQRFQVKKMENERKKQSVQFEEQQEDAEPDEDGRMEMDVKETGVNIWRCDRGLSPRTCEN